MVSAKKKIKIKDLAEKYKISPKQVLHELGKEGIELESGSSVIPADIVELVEDHLASLFGNQSSKTVVEEKKVDISPSTTKNEIHLKTPVVVKTLAEALGRKPNEVIQLLIGMNILAGINQPLETDIASKVCEHFKFTLVVERREKIEHNKKKEDAPEETDKIDSSEGLETRPPVVTFLGHVDHGKTSLQDRIRKTSIVSGEAGGITQHIGASTVSYKNQTITFIDTPGHEAFTAMRARGANATDIAILVVAANDGFMPQTVEALSHIKAAGVPLIIAINKIDLPQANPEHVYLQMQQNGLLSEEWGGDVGTVKVSALTGQGIDELLERILLEAEMLDLKANPKKLAKGVVLEAQLEQGLGPTVHVLIQDGSLHVGDPILCGEFFGKVRGLVDDKGKKIKMAGPSMPAKVIGLSGVPEAGDQIISCKNEKEAKNIAEERAEANREDNLSVVKGVSLEDLFAAKDESKKKHLKVVIKADVRGSCEAIADSLMKIISDKISIDVIHAGVGSISDNDILLAAASNAIVVGFHVRVNAGVNNLAKREGVEIRLYSIIYHLIEDIQDAMVGQLAPEKREVPIGTGHILQIFNLSKGPAVCGSMIDTGYVRVGAKARVYRDKELIYNGEVRSLRRFQDDVKEVRQGLECGIRLDNFKEFEKDDFIQFYEIKTEKATL